MNEWIEPTTWWDVVIGFSILAGLLLIVGVLLLALARKWRRDDEEKYFGRPGSYHRDNTIT